MIIRWFWVRSFNHFNLTNFLFQYSRVSQVKTDWLEQLVLLAQEEILVKMELRDLQEDVDHLAQPVKEVHLDQLVQEDSKVYQVHQEMQELLVKMEKMVYKVHKVSQDLLVFVVIVDSLVKEVLKDHQVKLVTEESLVYQDLMVHLVLLVQLVRKVMLVLPVLL